MDLILEFISKYKDLISLNELNSINILSILVVIITLYIFKRINNFYLISLLTLPGTFMHEMMHLIASFISFGKPVSFTIIPKKKGAGLTLGSVSSANIRWYNAIIISLAPLLLFVIAYYLLIYIQNLDDKIYFYLGLYMVANLIFAGMPSSTDWKLAFKKSWILLLIIIVSILEYKFHLIQNFI